MLVSVLFLSHCCVLIFVRMVHGEHWLFQALFAGAKACNRFYILLILNVKCPVQSNCVLSMVWNSASMVILDAAFSFHFVVHFFFLEKLWNATYLNQGRAGMCVCVRFFLCEYLIGLSRNKVYFRIFFLFWPCFVITNIIAFDIVTNSLCFCKPLNVHVVHILHGFLGCLNREEGIAQVHTGMQFSTLWPTVNAQCLHFVQAFVQRAVGYFTVWPDRISRVPAFSRKPFHLIFF